MYKRSRDDLERAIKAAKRQCRDKLDDQFNEKDSRRLWQGLQAITSNKGKSKEIDSSDAKLQTLQTTSMPVSTRSILNHA